MKTETLGEYGSPITLPCEAVGIPAPTMTWYRNAELLDTSSGYYSIQEDGSLLIKKVRIEDMGMFQCLASNEAGEDSVYTWLKVKSKFDYPSAFEAAPYASVNEACVVQN